MNGSTGVTGVKSPRTGSRNAAKEQKKGHKLHDGDAKSAEHKKDKHGETEELEFGGWPGAMALMIWSHFMPLYMWVSLEFHHGSLFFGPSSWSDPTAWKELWSQLSTAAPTAQAWAIYGTFFMSQFALFFVCPGLTVVGLPVPSENNRRLVYHCNAFCSWIITLLGVFVLHYSGVFSLSTVSRLRGQLIVVSMITADIIALVMYVAAVFVFKNGHRLTGNHLYDFFMGAWLNPRIGSLDLKLWAEIKMSWVTLFLLVLSSAVGQYEASGIISYGMLVLVFAQGLYANACMKGEECVVSTWDIFAEKWGWMLIFWNLCGVPFVYTFQVPALLVQNYLLTGTEVQILTQLGVAGRVLKKKQRIASRL